VPRGGGAPAAAFLDVRATIRVVMHRSIAATRGYASHLCRRPQERRLHRQGRSERRYAQTTVRCAGTITPSALSSRLCNRSSLSLAHPLRQIRRTRSTYQPAGVTPLAGADADGGAAAFPSGCFSGQPARQTSDVTSKDQPSSAFMRRESHGARRLHKPMRHEACSSTHHAEP
jgi:hypothetical protein